MVRFWTFVSIGARLDVSWLVSHIFYAWLCAWITNFYVLWNEAGTNHWRTFVSLFRSCLVVPTKSNKKVTAHHMCVRDATMRRLWKQRVECGLSYVGFLWYVHINHERKKRSNLFWLWRFHSNLAISGYVAFVSGKCLGMAISLCQLEECLQKCDDPCVLYMAHGSVLSESFVVVVLLHCRPVHMKFTGHVVKPWTVYFCADGLTELWGTLHKMLKLMGTCHVLMRVRCTYPYIDCGHQLFWVAHNHSKQIDWQH